MSKIVRFHRFGGPDVLEIETIDVAPPGAGEVQVDISRIGINRAEALMRSGRYIETPTLPSGLGLEAAGIVSAIGEGVQGLGVGDRVSIMPPVAMTASPTYAERANFPSAIVLRLPDWQDFDTAAAAWMQYLTSYGALIDIAGLQAGEGVLITAASSSTGLAAIQIARLVGAVPIALTRSREKVQPLREAGAAHVLVTSDGDVEPMLREIAQRIPMGLLFDAVGGPLFASLAAALRPRATAVVYGAFSPDLTPFSAADLLAGQILIRGYLVHHVTKDAQRLARAQAFILQGLHSGALRPIVAGKFPLSRIVDAHRELERGEHVGKILVTT